MKALSLAITLASMIGLAQATTHEHDNHLNMASHTEHSAMHQGIGVVKAVKTGNIQIAHEPISSLDWPAMTMWFEINGHVGHDIQVGDQVSFKMMQGKNKRWGLESIERN
jgi:Cu/Ag efflux protein CusF